MRLAQIDSIEEKELGKTPILYKSMAGNPTVDRLHRTSVEENLPEIVEYMQGSVKLNEFGSTQIIIPFKNQIFTAPPLVVGFGMHPSGVVVKFPAEDALDVWDFYSGFVGTYYTYMGIGVITTNNVQLMIETGYRVDFDEFGNPTYTYTYPNKVFTYKLRVYNVK